MIGELSDIEEGVVDSSIPGDVLDKAPPKEAAAPAEPRKLSIRESIKNAVERTEAKAKPNEKYEEPKERAPRKVERETEVEEKETPRQASKKPVEAETPREPKRERETIAAPKGWTKEAKEVWDQLPEAVKVSVAKREEEASQGFKTYGEKAKKLEEYDNVIQRYTPDFQQFGVTAPQMVERTLQWLNALRNPNRGQAIQSFTELARMFGLENDIAAYFGAAATGQQYQPVEQQPYSEIDEVRAEIERLKSYQAQSSQANAQMAVSEWSKDKPHFERVRANMHALLASGVIPLVAGKLDLDTAYERAVRLDPELYEEMLEAKLASKEAEYAKAAAAKAAKAREDVERAKRAGVSLRPTAPSSNPARTPAPKRDLSVSDSIRLAMKEVRGT
jgi:hypothetical protein